MYVAIIKKVLFLIYNKGVNKIYTKFKYSMHMNYMCLDFIFSYL